MEQRRPNFLSNKTLSMMIIPSSKATIMLFQTWTASQKSSKKTKKWVRWRKFRAFRTPLSSANGLHAPCYVLRNTMNGRHTKNLITSPCRVERSRAEFSLAVGLIAGLEDLRRLLERCQSWENTCWPMSTDFAALNKVAISHLRGRLTSRAIWAQSTTIRDIFTVLMLPVNAMSEGFLVETSSMNTSASLICSTLLCQSLRLHHHNNNHFPPPIQLFYTIWNATPFFPLGSLLEMN